jgi:hypothetical protein
LRRPARRSRASPRAGQALARPVSLAS